MTPCVACGSDLRIIPPHLLPCVSSRRLRNVTPEDGQQRSLVEETEETKKLNDVWNYFEHEGSKARCVVCRENVGGTAYEILKSHLFEQHPKLLLHLVQDAEQDEKSIPNSDSEDNDNTYTEVVYLEQDSCPEDTIKPSQKPKTKTPKRAQKRNRNNSSSDTPITTLKQERNEEKDDDTELEAFIKYIKCLLKKLPANVFSKVQVDILKTIMDAQYSSKISDTRDSKDTSSTPNILTDIANGTVTHVIGEAIDSATLLGNYTVTLASKNNIDSNK